MTKNKAAHRQRKLARRINKKRRNAAKRVITPVESAEQAFDAYRMRELERFESSLDFPHDILSSHDFGATGHRSGGPDNDPRRTLLSIAFDDEGEIGVFSDGEFDFAAHAHECSVCARMAATGP